MTGDRLHVLILNYSFNIKENYESTKFVINFKQHFDLNFFQETLCK